jgi:hypothetical protein
MLRTRPAYSPKIRAAAGVGGRAPDLADFDIAVLAPIAYNQPISRNGLTDIFDKQISRDRVADGRRKCPARRQRGWQAEQRGRRRGRCRAQGTDRHLRLPGQTAETHDGASMGQSQEIVLRKN